MIFNEYANYYDLFYKRKNYSAECEFLENVFERYMDHQPKTILDLGCGTGGHLLALLKRGYRMTGMDASPFMLEKAAEKLQQNKLKAKLVEGNISSFDLDQKFDVVICMFSVINYLKESALKNMISSSARHMKASSLFIFDFWNAQAVENFYTPKKSKIFRIGDKTLERASVTKIFPKKKIAEVHYTCTLRNKNRTEKIFREKHVLHYFTPEEITNHLAQAGFKLLKFFPFNQANGRINRKTWDITAVAQKIKS